MYGPAPRPRLVTIAAVILGGLGLLSIETVRRLLIDAVAWLAMPGPLSRPILLALFVAGIALFALALVVAVVGGIQIVTAGRMLHGHGWSRYEALALSFAGAALSLVAIMVGDTRGSDLASIVHGVLVVVSLPGYALVAAVVLRSSWFAPVPGLPWHRDDEQAAEMGE